MSSYKCRYCKVEGDDLTCPHCLLPRDKKCQRCEDLQVELSETKDYLNAIFQIMKPLIPACPMTMRKMWAKAMDDGKKIRSEATQQFEELQLQRDRLQQRNKEHEMFRHQHRDCNEMSIDNQKLRAEKKRYREVLVEALSIAEQSIDDPDTVLIEHLKQALQEKI